MSANLHELPPGAANDTAAMLRACFDRQRRSHLADPVPDYAQRRQDLLALKRLVSENREAIIDAISRDFGNRSRHETTFADILPVVDGINDVLRHLKRWMKPQRRHVDALLYPGARNRVYPQPLGVAGIIVPWNFPVYLSVLPLAYAFAAGNRAMVKMSENSVALTRLLIERSPKYFPADKLSWFEETGGVGIEFSKIPFDLILFTGSGQTGRSVMACAAENLTPVILELGGKSPAIIAPDYPLEKAVGRLLFVKQFNAGQVCTNVDYVFVHRGQKQAFIDEALKYVARHCPDIGHEDYTSIIDDNAYDRLLATLEDARDKGATVVNLSPGQHPDRERRKIPMHLVLDTTENMTIRRREIFGPLLMVLTYSEPGEVIEYINAHDRPLAIYPFTNDRDLAMRYIEHTMSGGVTVNDGLLHVAQHDLPFGGVGPSGMGHYHGYEGFLAFSKLRPVFWQARFSALKFLRPPYGKRATAMLDLLLRLKG